VLAFRENLEVSGSEQSREPAKLSVGVDPLQAILTPTITAISEWKRFKANKHHVWLNVARIEETIDAFEGRVERRDANNESTRQQGKSCCAPLTL
jgi:hypothetical protein